MQAHQVHHVPIETSATTIKVGDKVCRTPYTEGEDHSFYRVRAINNGIFEVDPNGPFERAWKGKVDHYKQHPTYPGYWVLSPVGVSARAAMNAAREAANSTPIEVAYVVAVNWYGELLKAKVHAHSEAQAMLLASKKLAKTSLTAYTSWHIHNYMKSQSTRVTLKQL